MVWRRPGGFDAVLSNPPWDIMQPNTAEFLAGLRSRDPGCRAGSGGARDSGPAAGRSVRGTAWRGLPGGVRASAATGAKRLTGISRLAHMAASWAASWTSTACSPSACCGWRVGRRDRHGGAVGFPRQRGRDRRPRALPAADRAWNGACHSRTGRACSISTRAFKFALVVARRPGPTREGAMRLLSDGLCSDRCAGAADGLRYRVHRAIRRCVCDAARIASRQDVAMARRMFVGQSEIWRVDRSTWAFP